jgi:toxin ParE1/3/4
MPSYEKTVEAEDDLAGIVEYTAARWGVQQVRKYMHDLEQCMEKLATGKLPFKTLNTLSPPMRMVRCGHHYIFGMVRDNEPMLIVAVLHERMNLISRLRRRLEE